MITHKIVKIPEIVQFEEIGRGPSTAEARTGTNKTEIEDGN